MAINLPLAVKVGLSKSIKRARKKEEDANENIKELNNLKRQWLFTTYQTDTAADRKTVTERMKKIKQATLLGFSKESAALLEASGELDLQLPRLKKLYADGDLNGDNVKKISSLVMESLKDNSDKATAALKYLAQGDFKIAKPSEFQDEFINAIFSADPDSLEKAATILQKTRSGRGGTSFEGFTTEYNTRVYETYESKERQIDNLIAQRILPLFGSGLEMRSTKDGMVYSGDAKAAAGNITNAMKNVIKENFNSPLVLGDYTDSIETMTENLRIQIESVGAGDIKYDDLKVSDEPTETFKLTYTPLEPGKKPAENTGNPADWMGIVRENSQSVGRN